MSMAPPRSCALASIQPISAARSVTSSARPAPRRPCLADALPHGACALPRWRWGAGAHSATRQPPRQRVSAIVRPDALAAAGDDLLLRLLAVAEPEIHARACSPRAVSRGRPDTSRRLPMFAAAPTRAAACSPGSRVRGRVRSRSAKTVVDPCVGQRSRGASRPVPPRETIPRRTPPTRRDCAAGLSGTSMWQRTPPGANVSSALPSSS